MEIYRVLDWPPFVAVQQQRQHQDSPKQEQAAAAAAVAAAVEVQEGADVAPTAPRPYRGPRLRQLCVIHVDASGQVQGAASVVSTAAAAPARTGDSKRRGTKKEENQEQHWLLAVVVAVPGLMEVRGGCCGWGVCMCAATRVGHWQSLICNVILQRCPKYNCHEFCCFETDDMS